MSARTALLFTVVAVFSLPSVGLACGMPSRGEGNLLVQLKAIETQPEPSAEDTDNRTKLTITAERTALAESVAERLAEDAPVATVEPKS